MEITQSNAIRAEAHVAAVLVIDDDPASLAIVHGMLSPYFRVELAQGVLTHLRVWMRGGRPI